MGSGPKRPNVKSVARAGSVTDGDGNLDLDCPEDGLLKVSGDIPPRAVGQAGEIVLSGDGVALVTGSGVVAASPSLESRRVARCISQGRAYRGQLGKAGDAASIDFWEVF